MGNVGIALFTFNIKQTVAVCNRIVVKIMISSELKELLSVKL